MQEDKILYGKRQAPTLFKAYDDVAMQSDIINGLFLLLGQYISSDELDTLPEVKKINEAAGLKNDLSRILRQSG